MAVDFITVNGNKIATDVDGSDRHHQVLKMAYGADDTITLVTASVGLPITLLAGAELIGEVDVNNFPAADRTTDTTSCSTDIMTVMSNRTELVVKFAVISENTSGDQQVLAGVSGKKFRILSYDLVCIGANTLTWKSGTTAISGAKSFAANGGQVKSHPQGVMETLVANTALNLNLSASTQVSGELSYVEF